MIKIAESSPLQHVLGDEPEELAMSFQAYLDNIEAKTGKTPDDFRRLAREKGFVDDESISPGVKATQITDWLKTEFSLGHGHAMAIYTLLKGAKKEGDR